MDIIKWMRKERSGLVVTTLELAKYEQLAGNRVSIRQPGEDQPLYGSMLTGDIHTIHSQLGLSAYHDGKPKFMWMHGEPLSSVGNGVSMKSIIDLAPLCEAFVCMRRDEWPIWNSIRKTFLVQKGIDLDVYKPVSALGAEKLSGEPAILYYENWRGSRNPLMICTAMERVWKRYPKARLHLFNCGDKKMQETFKALIAHNKWWTFIRSLEGPVPDNKVNELLNRADMVVSGLFPLYARSIEAFGAGKPLVCPGYREHDDYPFRCDLSVDSIADAICRAWENKDKHDWRQWAVDRHNVATTVAQSMDVYRRYM